ncbi:MAG: DUF1684 domain-containing protein [Saprospiraceae bacterium]|nr:DUF1684 domain-containing protein [Candidatus Vicinibacter affinis]HQX43858.1 DUF1684 domain-containing protein [Saprospiraceae bacterium]
MYWNSHLCTMLNIVKVDFLKLDKARISIANFLAVLFSIGLIGICPAQDYQRVLTDSRSQTAKDHLADPRSPITKKDLKHLHYYAPDGKYSLEANFEEFAQKDTVTIPTSSGKQKLFIRFGRLNFKLDGQVAGLTAYLSTRTGPGSNHFFVPFYDLTNGAETYGGGRFMDIDHSLLVDGKLPLDFNYAYNPWCAYSSGFNCPIPPEENRLTIPIYAGEKSYTGKHRKGSKS